MNDSPRIPLRRLEVCHYCKHQAIGPNDYKLSGGGASGYACSLSTEGGRLMPITAVKFPWDSHSIDGSKGCERFEASGLPAHPLAIDKMIAYNELAATIPSDPTASFDTDFDAKMREYPHVDYDPY